MSVPLRETVMVVGIVLSVCVLGCRPHGPSGATPSATVVAPQRTTTYHVRDESGRLVAVTIPALGTPDVKVSDPAAGTVPATVTALDAPKSQAQVQTQKGQRLVLTLPPELLARMQVGDRFLLQVAPPAGQ
jgi:hypothetical protein